MLRLCCFYVDTAREQLKQSGQAQAVFDRALQSPPDSAAYQIVTNSITARDAKLDAEIKEIWSHAHAVETAAGGELTPEAETLLKADIKQAWGKYREKTEIEKSAKTMSAQDLGRLAEELGLDLLWQTQNRNYQLNGGQSDRAFDLDRAKADYGEFLTKVPENNKIFLEQSYSVVPYVQKELERAPFGYSEKYDTIYYDPTKPEFWDLDFAVASTHELAHRIDYCFVRSFENKQFSEAIMKSKSILDADPSKFQKFCSENDRDGFISDVLGAICESKYRFPFRHEPKYWKEEGRKEKETFANLFSLECMNDERKLNFLKKELPVLMEAYRNLDFSVR